MSVPLFPINQEKLSKVLKSEFELWVHNFGKRSIPRSQELRAFFIQWFAVFVPECFEQPLVKEISAFAYETKQRVDFRRSKWYELLPIEVALYALSSDSSWINMARANLNHHNSSLRSLVLESLLLVVDKLRFDDPYLLASVTDNLERWVFYDTDTALFLCMAQGEPEMKHIQIKRWLDQLNMSTNARQKLQALSDGEFVPNPFLHHVAQWTCYILLRLASQEDRLQSTHFLKIPNEFQLKFPIILGWIIKRQMMEHPLFQPFIRLERVKT